MFFCCSGVITLGAFCSMLLITEDFAAISVTPLMSAKGNNLNVSLNAIKSASLIEPLILNASGSSIPAFCATYLINAFFSLALSFMFAFSNE